MAFNKDKWMIGFAAVAGSARLAYTFWPKKNQVPAGPFHKFKGSGSWHAVNRPSRQMEKGLKDVRSLGGGLTRREHDRQFPGLEHQRGLHLFHGRDRA